MPVLLSQRPASAPFNLGCILIGSYINSMLYALAMFCVYVYYRGDRSKRDPLLVKLAVAGCAVMDTVATFGVCGSYFYLSVLRWGRDFSHCSLRHGTDSVPKGDYDYEFRAHWLPIMTFVASAFSEIIVQAFMVRRYFLMSKQYLICAFIVVLMLLSLEANLYLAISSAVGALPASERPTNLTPFMYAYSIGFFRIFHIVVVLHRLSLSSTLASDVCTTIAMFWTLQKTNTYTNITHHIVSRISVIVVVTGTLTCVVVLASMITFLAYPISALTTTFTCFVGRVYSLSMLFTLLYRDMVNNNQWIQVDEVTENVIIVPQMTLHRGADDNIRITCSPVSDATFAHRASLAHPRTQKDIEIHPHGKLDSQGTIRSMHDGEA
ncbi:hypothetical protein D9619_003836 [Psilocybe cf. subviscida]|uniref:DUF6534 domain-containing protein n=1 Tax=Psilocybe cf. subviscida TaxID=2480587 RepID=A0A8H5AYT1_9AGAR|nr:hypothetical protein D9619_003836 [Psilocybe cf. subviscida]